MIWGVGTDIIEISRIKKLMENPGFCHRCFTVQEINYIDGHAESAAAIYSAKEAYSKALGTGIRGFSLKDIEIFHEPTGKPYIKAYNKAVCEGNIFLTISHCREYACAFVIIEKI